MKYFILPIVLFFLIISNVHAIKVNLTELVDHAVMEVSGICDPSNVYYVGASNVTSDHIIGYWKFNNTIPTGSYINDVKLFLNLYSSYVDNNFMNLTVYHVYNQSWTCISWSDQPCNNVADCNQTYESRYDNYGKYDSTLPTQTYYNWIVTEMFNKDYNDGKANFSVMMKSISNAPTNLWEFYSMDFTSSASKPYLEVDYTPYLTSNQIDFSKFNYIKQFGQILHNHNVCVDNESLGHNVTYTIKIDQNQSIINVWVNEPCTFGCDNSTMACNEPPINQYFILGIILLALVIIILVLIKVAKT